MIARQRGLAVAAALVVAASPCPAAELPKPAPDVPHLGACGVSGGFLLPGTDACLTIGGTVLAEGAWRLAAPPVAFVATPTGPAPHAAGRSDRLDRPALGIGARLTADMRMPTDLGPVRVFVSLRGRNAVATDRAAR